MKRNLPPASPLAHLKLAVKILATAIAQAIELKPWPTADEFDFAVDVSTGLALAAVRSQWGHLPTETAVCVTRMIATSFGRSCPPGLAHATTKAAYEVVMNAIQPPDKPLTIGQTYRRIDAAIAAILCAGSAGQAANANQPPDLVESQPVWTISPGRPPGNPHQSAQQPTANAFPVTYPA